MELYDSTSYELSKRLTTRYSSSFGLSSRLFNSHIRPHIYAIYGLVRIADEIVDTYKKSDSGILLSELESETLEAIERSYSPNPVVHAFALTARKYDFDRRIITTFFKSMRMDLTPVTYDQSMYKTYIHGSAEVVGLMCLAVFTEGDKASYTKLQTGAKALGSAYQKVNFLRDLTADFNERGRLYFPNVTFDSFNEDDKHRIIKDIKKDFRVALPYLNQLPSSAQRATRLSYDIYKELLVKLDTASVETIKQNRIRISNTRKIILFATLSLRSHA